MAFLAKPLWSTVKINYELYRNLNVNLGLVIAKLMYENLQILKKDYNWLKKELSKFNILPEQALIATIDGKGEIFCQEKTLK